VSCWLGIALVPAFIALDATLHPHLVHVFIWIRLAMLAGSALVLLALPTSVGTAYVAALSLAAFLEVGAGIVAMTAFNGGGSSPYYAGVNLVMLAAAVLMPWEPLLSATCCLVLVAAYALASIVWGGVPDVRVFTGNLFFLNSTAVITIVSHVVGARARRREFLQRVELDEAGRHREQFLANVSHELRTPLAAIFGYTEMLRDFVPNLTSDQRGWLARISDNAGALYRLIVQLLDFSNLEAGTLTITCAPFRLDAVATKVATELRGTAECADVEISVDVADDAPAGVAIPSASRASSRASRRTRASSRAGSPS
jgi:signal transduction histidine kinase